MSLPVIPSSTVQHNLQSSANAQAAVPATLDVSKLGFPVAEAGQPGPVCLLNPHLKPGTTAIRTLLIHERSAQGGDLLERCLEEGEHASLSIRADQFDSDSREALSQNFSSLLEELRDREIIDKNTEIYICLHGKAEKETVFLSNSSKTLRVDICALLADLGRGTLHSPSRGVVRIFCCESEILRKTLIGFPHPFLLLSDRWSMTRIDAFETLKEQFRLSSLCGDEPPTPEQALRNAAMVSGENPTLTGNATLQTIEITSLPAEDLKSRPIQLDNYLARTVIHGTYDKLTRLLVQHDVANNKIDIFSPAMCVAADIEPERKLLLAIALGADINKFDAGQTALHYASKLQNPDLVRILLQHGADPSLKNTDGITARELAEKRGHEGIIAAFENIEQANKTSAPTLKTFLCQLVDQADLSALQLIVTKNPNCLQQLSENQTSLLYYAIKKNQNKAANLLMQAKPQLHLTSTDQQTPLHLACLRQNTEIVRSLLAAGASVDTPNSQGVTPLGLAIIRGDIEIAELLLNAGANINHCNHYGKTALHLAIEKKQLHSARTLLSWGIDFHIRDNKGRTALDIALRENNTDMIKLLEKADKTSAH